MSFFDLNISVHKDDLTGFALTKTLKQQVYQKFKILLLMNPGERMMDSKMGIGLRRALFASNFGDTGLYSNISNRIVEQVTTHMKYLEIEDVQYNESAETPNTLYMKILFSIPALNIIDELLVKTNEAGNLELFFGAEESSGKYVDIDIGSSGF